MPGMTGAYLLVAMDDDQNAIDNNTASNLQELATCFWTTITSKIQVQDFHL
jgi:hypothetical protein